RGTLVEWPIALVGERNTIHIAEEHGPAKTKLLYCAFELANAGLGVVERQRRQSREARATLRDDTREGVIDDASELGRAKRLLDVCTRCRQCEHLHVDAGLLEHLRAIRDVAVAANGDVVVTGIVQQRISSRVNGQLDSAGPLSDRV